MILPSFNLVCKAAYVEEYLKELEAGKTEENYARFLDAAIHSERDSHVHQALEMIRANIGSNEGNKGELYYQLGFGLYRIGDVEGAKRALEDCLKIDGTMWGARNMLEQVELILRADEPKNLRRKSTLPNLVAVAGGLAFGVTCGCLSNSKLLKRVALMGTCGCLSNSKLLKRVVLVGGIAVGAAYSEELVKFARSVTKAGELGESIEKMTVTSKDTVNDSYPTDGNKAGFFTAGAAVGIVGATFLICLKKSSSG